MITGDFYQTERTVCAGAVSLTDNITNIDLDGSIADIATPYYIGYVNFDDMPKLCVPMFPKFDRMGDDQILSFYQTPENHSWGFVYSFNSGTTTEREKNMYYRTSLTDTKYTAQYTSTDRLHRFLNKIQMCNYAGSNLIQLGFHAFVVPIADIEDGTTKFKGAQSDGTYRLKTFTNTYDSNLGENRINLNILQRLINNEIPVMTGPTSIGGEDLPFPDIYYSDFNEFGLASKDTNNGVYRVFLWIDRIWVFGWGFYAGAQQYACAIEPFFEFTLPESADNYPEQTALYTPGEWRDYDFRIGMANNELYLQTVGLFTGNVMISNIPYSISKKDLLDAGIAVHRNGVVKNSFVLIEAGGSDSSFSHYFYPHFDLNDIYKYLMFFHKIDIQGTTYNNTTASDTYTTRYSTALFNATDTPLYERLSEDFQTIEDKLRPWQMPNTDITVNDYDPIDKPPYVPPGPTPGGDDNSETGDKIPNQFGRNVGVTSNFITQYLMTQGQISKLGEVLWTSWADDTVTMDMVENFYGKLHDETGSWNVSSALQFLVSCRMFPVSLATLVGTTATTSIPIGTGAFALQCGTASEPTFFIANESVAVLNCGDVYVPKEFGDYRDFDNTNITAYLPYCGSVQLSPQDVVGKWIGCTYAIDLFDGSCKAFLYTLSGDDVGYQGAYYNVAIKEGQCGFLIPMSATQAGEVASRRKVDSYVDGSMLFNAGSTMLDGTMRIASGDGLGAIGADVGRLANLGFAYNTMSAQRMGRAGIAAPTIAGGSGFADFMQPASPYIQIRRSRYQMPIQYENSAAYPANAQNYGNLSQFTGFVQCKNVDVHGFTCHEEERSAIKALLESGVYL